MGDTLTLRDVSVRWLQALQSDESAPAWLIGDLLDDFRLRTADQDEQRKLLEEEPVWEAHNFDETCNAYWAAVAETLSMEAGIPPPAWTRDPRTFLKYPWFAGGMESLKAILLAESPVPFRRRNLFVSANALSRV